MFIAVLYTLWGYFPRLSQCGSFAIAENRWAWQDGKGRTLNSRFCRWLGLPAFVLCASGLQAQCSSPACARKIIAALEQQAASDNAAAIPSQSRVSRLMADTEYGAFLAQIDALLPKLEASLQNIDPEKNERISYLLGKSIVLRGIPP
jgi:hypothetical protein